MAGVTGARSGLPADLKDFVERVRAATDKPLSVGFGISSQDQVKEVAGIADGVVVGSAFMNAVDEVRSGLFLSLLFIFGVTFTCESPHILRVTDMSYESLSLKRMGARPVYERIRAVIT